MTEIIDAIMDLNPVMTGVVWATGIICGAILAAVWRDVWRWLRGWWKR